MLRSLSKPSLLASRITSLLPCFWNRAIVPFRINSMSASVSSLPAAMDQVPAENRVQEIKPLTARNDEHDGVTVELSEHMDSGTFASMLRASITHWRNNGKRGVWIKVPIELVHLVEAAVKQGFWFHHAEPNYLMLAYWIPEVDHTLPANASHRVGVGAIVMNEKQEVLVVQENSGQFRGTGIWKFPTGAVDEGEDISAAAVREVKEETAIDTEFIEVLAFRQSHRTFFTKSDLFFVCVLRPLSFDIQRQELEIEAARWMPWDDFVKQPFVQSNELLKHITDAYLAKKDGKYSGFCPKLIHSSISNQSSYLYLNARDMQITRQPLDI